MLGQGCAVTQDKEETACSGECHIHASGIGEEADITGFIGADEVDQDGFFFSALEAVNAANF